MSTRGVRHSGMSLIWILKTVQFQVTTSSRGFPLGVTERQIGGSSTWMLKTAGMMARNTMSQEPNLQ